MVVLKSEMNLNIFFKKHKIKNSKKLQSQMPCKYLSNQNILLFKVIFRYFSKM